MERPIMRNGISIIIPTYNEQNYIGLSIDSIIKQMSQAKLPYEIIVVDNLSTDNTAQIVAQYPVTYLACPIKGSPSATRNLGARQAKYDTFCFIDGDCLVIDNWLEQITNAFANPSVGAYGGPALSPQQGNWIEKAWAPTAIKPYLNRKSALPGANFCIRVELFSALNGFDETLTTAEDDDLSKRIIASGYEVVADSNHPVIHLGYPKTLLDIYKKQIWHGSSQLKAHGLLGDKMVIMTMAWAASAIGLILALLANPFFAIFFSIIFLSCPLLVAVKRTSKFNVSKTLLIPRAYLISFYFLAGRTVGLLKEAISRN
jgi:glycosyltransferase involved in cell wall biosynthesis